jgi:hypothetical protein
MGSMTLVYREGVVNEADPLSRPPGTVPYAKAPLFWDGEVPSKANLRRKSPPLLEDAYLNLLVVNALRLSLEFADLTREGYSQDSFYGDEGELTKDSRIEAKVGYFWHLNCLCVSRNFELRLGLITKLHDNSAGCHRGFASPLPEALDRFRWKRIRQDAKQNCERYIVC